MTTFQSGKWQLIIKAGEQKSLVGQSGELLSKEQLDAWSSQLAGQRPLQAGEEYLLVSATDARAIQGVEDLQQTNRGPNNSAGLPPTTPPGSSSLDKTDFPNANKAHEPGFTNEKPEVKKEAKPTKFFGMGKKQPTFAQIADYEKKISHKRTAEREEAKKAVTEHLKVFGIRI